MVACEGFSETAIRTAEAEEVYGLSVIGYPGHTAVDTNEVVKEKTRDIIVPEAIKAWTEKPIDVSDILAEPKSGDIVFKGTYDEVNAYYYEKQWGDGLPIVPPTIKRIEEFLKYTPLPADKVIGVLPPSFCEATIWNVGVNGAMSGCRPEYMPVLVAIAEALAEPGFSLKDAGSTGGWEVSIILNGPIFQQLKFNYGIGMLRAGHQPNISIARFMRMYLRNIAGFRTGESDLSSFGRDYYNLVFVEDQVNSPWEPLSVDRGFNNTTNLVTLQGITLMSKHCQPTGGTAAEMLDNICRMLEVAAMEGAFFVLRKGWGPDSHDLLCITPLIAKKIAERYKKEEVQQYIWEHVRLPAKQIMARHLYDVPIGHGELPEEFDEGKDPEKLVHLWRDPEDIYIFVGGDYTRNRAFLCRGTGRMGLATSKEVKLPVNWNQLISGPSK